MELLVEALAGTVAAPLDSPLATEMIVVPNRGMARWLSMQLADRLGVWGNTEFLFPDHFANDLFRRVFPDLPRHTVFDREVLPWKIMSVLSEELLGDKHMEPLSACLRDGRSVGKFQLACDIADAFDQYTIFRPGEVLGWEEGRDRHWQAVLWRTITGGGVPHRARLRRDFLSAIGRLPENSLPSRIAVFGLSSLPPYHASLLAAVATLLPVHLFVLNPCAEFWDQIVSEGEAARIARRELPEAGAERTLHLEGGNPLLASLGDYGREFLSMLHDYDPQEMEIPFDPPGSTLLEIVQADMLHLYDRGASPELPALAIAPGDRSIEIHSCHTPQREIEVLYDYLLDLFDRDPTANPSDILVMTPDIAAYAPVIRAVFGSPENSGRRIPFALADVTAGSDGAVLTAFGAILSLPLSRFEATAVLSLLETPAIRAAFDIEESDLPTLVTWVRACGIRWGLGPEALRTLDLPAMPDNTWEAGVRRLLLGYALPSGKGRTFGGSAGFDDLEGSGAELAGRFLDFLDTLATFTQECGTPRSLTAWARLLGKLLDEVVADTGGESAAIREAIGGLSEAEIRGIPAVTVDYETIRACIAMLLDRTGSDAPFLSGGVTFCAMKPMRSIPFRVVCCIGMNDGAFPRKAYRPSWDLMAQHPRRGDRSLDREDRYLFLEAILSARQRLYISYIGRSVRDNSKNGPSVVVEHLLSAIDRGFFPEGSPAADRERPARTALIVEHPLQAWNPRCFIVGDPSGSFSDANAVVPGSPEGEASPALRFRTGELPCRQGENNLGLRQFIDFFRNPVKFLFVERLGMKLPDRDERVADTECFHLGPLDRYAIAGQLAGQLLSGNDREAVYALLKARGELPQGTVGKFEFDALAAEIGRFVEETVRPLVEREPKLPPLIVDGSFPPLHIAGLIDGCYPSIRLAWRCAKLTPGDYLAAWIPHLVLCAAAKPGYPTRTILAARDRTVVLDPVPGAREELTRLAALLETGMHSPLPLFPRTSFAFAEGVLVKDQTPEKARSRAAETWYGTDFSRGEAEDPYYAFCFRSASPIDADGERLALAVWGPVLRATGDWNDHGRHP
jgi:exodeoxyribonuclease V gamma subunit